MRLRAQSLNVPAAAAPHPSELQHNHTPRNQRKKRALAEAKERCGRLEAENAALLAQLEEQRAEGYAVVERFRGEVLAKNGQIAQLQV